jgi:NAD(P)-dependent dehydrogenase (short-subunit alcohol dehydrogenase family)
MANFVVIGGSTGIGSAIVEELILQKHTVFASQHKQRGNLEGTNYFEVDVTSENLDFGFLPDVLDGLVYAPGLINLKPFIRIKPEEFINDFNLQVVGAIKCIQALIPRLKKAENTASIVLFSTVAMQLGYNFHSLVSSSKGAIEGLTRSLASELAPQIRVNAIAPSLTDTPLAQNLLNSPEKIEANAQRHPLKRIGKAEDIAHMAVFLLSSKSSWISGQIMHVDGGASSLRV